MLSQTSLEHSPLEPLVRRAGATMTARHGWWVAAHYGSAPGELALCRTAVGLADRSDLGKLELRGEPGAVEQLVGQLTGGQIQPGDALRAAGAWWCSVSPEHVLVLCGADAAARVAAAVGAAARWTPGASVTDATRDLAAVGLLGPSTRAVLAALWSSDPPLEAFDAPELAVTMLAAVPVMVLLATADRAVIVTDRARAAELWTDLERAGQELGMGHVGCEALGRVALSGG